MSDVSVAGRVRAVTLLPWVKCCSGQQLEGTESVTQSEKRAFLY